MKLVTFGSGSATIILGAVSSWCADSEALVANGLYDLSSANTTPLEVNSTFCLCGH